MPLIIALTLNDFIYLTYKLEEEDFMKSVNDQSTTFLIKLLWITQKFRLCSNRCRMP